MIVFLMLMCVGVSLGQIEPYQENPCSSNGGKCVYDNCCPGHNYISGQCPSQSNSVICCYSTPSCTYNDLQCQGEGGVCLTDDDCPGNDYLSSQCPAQASNVKCCYGVIEPYQENPCKSSGGKCVYDNCCPGNNYISGQCPSQSGNVRCCHSTPSCTYNESPCQDDGGVCLKDYDCPGNNYLSGKCPAQASDVKCCYSICGITVQDLACQIQAHTSVFLLTVSPSGVDDGADAASNIKDTCDGYEAKRSSYSCSSGSSPGGTVCLKESVLTYILDVANNAASPSNTVQVNSISGACHSSSSWHYQGTAVDFQVKSGSPTSTYMSLCSSNGAVENLGPGDPGHSTHTHCSFNG